MSESSTRFPALTRVRAAWATVLRPLAPVHRVEDAAQQGMRADVSTVLVRAPLTDAATLEELMLDTHGEGGTLEAPQALLEGELELSLDPLEALRAAIGVATPLASADARLRETLDVASDAVSTFGRGARDVIEGLLTRVDGMPVKDDTAKAGDLYFHPVGKTAFDVTDTSSLLYLSADAMITVANKIALGQIEAGIAGGVDTTSDAPIALGDGLRKALLNPAVPVTRKRAAMAEIIAKSGVLPIVGRTLVLLAERDRLVLVPDVAEAFRQRLLDLRHHQRRGGLVREALAQLADHGFDLGERLGVREEGGDAVGLERLGQRRPRGPVRADHQRVVHRLGQVAECVLHRLGGLQPRLWARNAPILALDIGRLRDAQHRVVRGVELRLRRLHRVLDRRLQRGGREPQRELVARDARDVEQVVDQPHHERHLPLRGRARPLDERGVALRALDDLERRADRCERVAQFVRERGEELDRKSVV